MKKLRILKGGAREQSQPVYSEFIGKVIKYRENDGNDFFAKVFQGEDGAVFAKLCFPDPRGVLVLTQTAVDLDSVDIITDDSKYVTESDTEKKVLEFQTSVQLNEEVKAVEVKRDGEVIDYRDLRIDGYASTFQETTPEDRVGDYVVQGAFKETLVQYRKNPVVLIGHENRPIAAVGFAERIGEDQTGLYFTDKISNDPDLKWLRWRLMERVLRTVSIGGIFFYGEDNRGIEKVSLFEHSIVAVPANPDALFTTRALNQNAIRRIYGYSGETEYGTSQESSRQFSWINKL